MKKVVCPACGLVNLERFVTYPHCAACGARLTDAPDETVPLWKRPVSAPLWATAIGFCCVGLGLAGILAARETRVAEEKLLVVYVQTPQRLRVGQAGQLRLGLDAVEGGAVSRGLFQELQVRLPDALFENFTLLSIVPTPQNRIRRRNGVYLEFGRMERDQSIVIALRARRAGLHPVAFSLYARDFPPLQWRSKVQILPRAVLGRAVRWS